MLKSLNTQIVSFAMIFIVSCINQNMNNCSIISSSEKEYIHDLDSIKAIYFKTFFEAFSCSEIRHLDMTTRHKGKIWGVTYVVDTTLKKKEFFDINFNGKEVDHESAITNTVDEYLKTERIIDNSLPDPIDLDYWIVELLENHNLFLGSVNVNDYDYYFLLNFEK